MERPFVIVGVEWSVDGEGLSQVRNSGREYIHEGLLDSWSDKCLFLSLALMSTYFESQASKGSTVNRCPNNLSQQTTEGQMVR